MSFKSKVFAVSLVFSLGFFGPNSNAFASNGEAEGTGCCGCWTGFVSGLKSCFSFCMQAVDQIDEVLDEVDDRLEQFQGIVTKLDRRIAALSTIAGLDENEHVLRIHQGLGVVNGHIEMVQALIGAVDDVVEAGQDGVSIQDVWTSISSVRTALGALHDADLINAGHVEGANARIDQVADRIDGLEGFWNMGTAIANSYRGFSSVNGTFEDENISGSGSVSISVEDEVDL